MNRGVFGEAMMALRVGVAGVTGWTGSAVAKGVLASEDLTLAAAIARKAAGQDLGKVFGRAPIGLAVDGTVEAALGRKLDVLVDYTHPTAVKAHALAAIGKGVAVIVGTSGLTAADYAELDRAAKAKGVGVIGSGNFSITANLLQHFAEIAARYVPDWEVFDYAKATKPDVPSGTAQQLAERLGEIGRPKSATPLDRTIGPKEARGADIAGTRVHSIRLPSYIIACEAQFGAPDERLTIRHDAGSGAQPYVAGTLFAVRKVRGIKGVIRGLDRLMFGSPAGS
jgi:4-hydroxy-tetrahydrodipicolinate reductase